MIAYCTSLSVLPTMHIAKMPKIDRNCQEKSLTSNLMTVLDFCATLFLREKKLSDFFLLSKTSILTIFKALNLDFCELQL